MQIVKFGGWKRNARLANREMELIVTLEVGPRILFCGFHGGRNLFARIAAQQGAAGESEWMIRGGHRLWIAPEEAPKTYELDNGPVEFKEIPNGVRTRQRAGALSGVRRTLEIALDPGANRVEIVHTLTNGRRKAVRLAPWAISVMAPGGMAVIPLPEKIPHTDRLTHNQEWSLWSYTDLSDPRWTIGSKYVLFRQDAARGPSKLGIAHREGWVAYLLDGLVFVKRFDAFEGKRYPDGGVNFETFSNEEFLELESLGPLVTLAPGKSVSHRETWTIFRDVPPCRSEADVDRHIRPLASS